MVQGAMNQIRIAAIYAANGGKPPENAGRSAWPQPTTTEAEERARD